MQKQYYFLVPAICLLFSCGNQPSKNQVANEQVSDTVMEDSVVISEVKRYEMKSGIVYYKPLVIMKGIKTTDVLYFDDYGNKECKESITETNIKGIKSKERKVSLLVDGYSISYILEKTENGKDVTPKEAYKIKIGEDLASVGQALGANLTDDMKKQLNYREEGTEIVAGVTGKKYSIAMGENISKERIFGVLYKNIPIKTNLGHVSIIAEKIEENATILSEKFEIPVGYTVIEKTMEEMMNGMKEGE